MCRSSVPMVSGTRLNTRRSPSVMRLVSTGWRWLGTVETPEIRWQQHKDLSSTPTVGCSALQTATTTTVRATVPFPGAEVGGMLGAPHPNSTTTRLCSGRPLILTRMFRTLAWWWKSTQLLPYHHWLPTVGSWCRGRSVEVRCRSTKHGRHIVMGLDQWQATTTTGWDLTRSTISCSWAAPNSGLRYTIKLW